jgi:hypothetical protein
MESPRLKLSGVRLKKKRRRLPADAMYNRTLTEELNLPRRLGHACNAPAPERHAPPPINNWAPEGARVEPAAQVGVMEDAEDLSPEPDGKTFGTRRSDEAGSSRLWCTRGWRFNRPTPVPSRYALAAWLRIREKSTRLVCP